MRHERGHDLWAVVSAVPLPEVGDDALLVCLDDATGRRNTERMLVHAALHDSLTNLPNRRLLRDRLDTALARAHRSLSTVAVLFIDLDHFKDVNDTFGHDAGDEVLVGVAAGIHAALRSCDTVARLGGDEFVVVCEDVAAEHDVTRLAERILEGVRRPVTVHGRAVSVAASIGIAIAGPHAETGDELIRLADLAMYRAKHRPDASYVLADSPSTTRPRPASGPATARPTDLLADLRHAIQADQLRAALPAGGAGRRRADRPRGAAALAAPAPGLLMPQDFLPRVAGTDLARPLSDWVLRAAVRDAASWHDPQVRVSVNMWAAEVARPGFAETVGMLLTWAGLQAKALYLELHESELPEAGPGLADELDQLRRLGVGLAIDDYGTGGMSLTSLRRLPVDTLKVDRSFVAGLLGSGEDRSRGGRGGGGPGGRAAPAGDRGRDPAQLRRAAGAGLRERAGLHGRGTGPADRPARRHQPSPGRAGLTVLAGVRPPARSPHHLVDADTPAGRRVWCGSVHTTQPGGPIRASACTELPADEAAPRPGDGGSTCLLTGGCRPESSDCRACRCAPPARARTTGPPQTSTSCSAGCRAVTRRPSRRSTTGSSAPVYGVIRRVLRDPAQSEEVTQEVMVEVWRTATRFDRTRGQRHDLDPHDGAPPRDRPGARDPVGARPRRARRPARPGRRPTTWSSTRSRPGSSRSRSAAAWTG